MMLPDLTNRYLKVFLGFIALVFVVNVLLLDFFFVAQRGTLLDFQTRLTSLSDSFRILGGRLYSDGQQTPPSADKQLTDSSGRSLKDLLNPVSNVVCPNSCIDLIALSTTAGRLSTRDLVSPGFLPSGTTASGKGEHFIPLGSGSISQTTNWTDLSSAQATFDASNFGTIKSAYFEAFLRTGGSGEVHARIFDTTTPAIIWGSDVSTTANTSTLVSAPISLTSGPKTYKVQMYSTISSGFLDQARIRIVTQ